MNYYIAYTLLYTGDDGKSYFKDVEVDTPHEGSFLGLVSAPFIVNELWFRHSLPGTYDWHTAPQRQFIIYLSGKAKVEASGGEVKIFGSGDVLYATDTEGNGHRSTIIEEGKALIISTKTQTTL